MAAAALTACENKAPVEPASGIGTLIFHIGSAPSYVETITVTVTGSGIQTPLVATAHLNANGATDTLEVPAGSDRLVVANAYDSGGTNTHRGDTTIAVVPGPNPTLSLVLQPLNGGVPIVITFASYLISLSPLANAITIGDTLRFRAVVADGSGDTVRAARVQWGSSNPALAAIDTAGLVTGLQAGTVMIVATYEGAGAARSLTVTTIQLLPLPRFMSGNGHSCGLAASGAAYCWGLNQNGQLGDGTTTDRASPVAVVGGVTFAALATGGGYGLHSCGLTASGAAYCWGSNSSGQLGDGTTTDRSSPVAVAGGLSFQALAVGYAHTCGVATTGAAYCWGANNYLELGDGTSTNRSTPVVVGGGLTFQRLAAGGTHTCGFTVSGSAYCWGDNQVGALGDGTNTSHGTPVAVAGGLTFQALAAGEGYTCGITSSGAAYCWGDDTFGELGSASSSNSPVPVAGGLSYQSISAGQTHTCALTAGGTAYCWGDNEFGELGDGSMNGNMIPRTTPAAVPGGLTFQGISVGPWFTCAVTTSGATYCWGLNAYGQVGDGTGGVKVSPTAVVGGLSFQNISNSDSHVCGVVAGGTAYCWGGNAYDILNDGTNGLPADSPMAFLGIPPVTAMSLQWLSTCGLAVGGQAYCWGDISFSSPVGGGMTFQSLSSADDHICGVTVAGAAYCWGGDDLGQLGDSGNTLQDNPVAVSGGLTFDSLSAGGSHTCGLTAGGAAYCWGLNSSGELGDGTNTNRNAPVAVSGDLTFVSISAGSSHTCGLTASGAAYCWGGNGAGQLGDGTNVWKNSPVAVNGGLTFASLSASPGGGPGAEHTCGITFNGAAYCWGFDGTGQLGNGSRASSNVPIAVAGALMFRRIAAGGDFGGGALGWTCALTTGGAAYCWGFNFLGSSYGGGMLGDGSAWRLSPVSVAGGITFGAPAARRIGRVSR